MLHHQILITATQHIPTMSQASMALPLITTISIITLNLCLKRHIIIHMSPNMQREAPMVTNSTPLLPLNIRILGQRILLFRLLARPLSFLMMGKPCFPLPWRAVVEREAKVQGLFVSIRREERRHLEAETSLRIILPLILMTDPNNIQDTTVLTTISNMAIQRQDPRPRQQ